VNTDVHLFIQYIHRLLSHEAFDDSVMGNMIDTETISLLQFIFYPTETHMRHPINNHWTIDWDVATIIEALEELYPLQAEHKHLDFGSRWQQVIDRSINRIRVESNNMAQVQRDTIQEWNNGSTTIGPIPHSMNTRVLTALAHSFTHRDNPSGNKNSNIAFQRDLDERLEADDEYQANPSLHRLCYLVSELIHHWEKLEMQSRRMSGSTSSQSSADKGKLSKLDKGRDQIKDPPTDRCQGCNRDNHRREDCRFRTHPDFNERGQWNGSTADRALRRWQKDEKEIKLTWGKRADGTILPLKAPDAAVPAAPPRQNNTDDGDQRRRRDNDRRDHGGRGGRGQIHFARDTGTPCLTSSITHLTCNCGGADVNSTYRQCLVSMRNSNSYFTALTLFDTGAYTSFVNREVAKWLEQQQHGGTVAGAHLVKSSRHDVSTSEVGLAGTQLSSSIYGTVVFGLTFFNEVMKSDNILKSTEANVIDSCIEVIIGLPDIRSHRLVHRIPSYFDSPDPTYLSPPQGISQANTLPTISVLVRRDTKTTSRALCKGSSPCSNCSFSIARGHDNTLCSVHLGCSPQCRDTFPHRMFTDDELIKTKDIFDPIEDDDDIEWKHNPFDIDSVEGSEETPEQLMSQITFEGSLQLQTKLKALVREFIDVFATKVRREPAAVEPVKIMIDEDKWRLPCNRAPPRKHSEEKQKEIRKQVDVLLDLGVIKESRATEWSQVHLVPKPTPEGQPQKWRFTLDFVRLNSATGGLERWPIPNIQQIINRIGTLKPKVFGIIDFTAGYHQTPLHPDSQEYTAFITQYGLFEWNRVAMGLKGSGPFFQRSMVNRVLAGYVTRICEIYIDDVLIHGPTR
jgi:hypothetical protein